jgi:hypothetical protein
MIYLYKINNIGRKMTEKRYCPKCGRAIEWNWNSCPYCKMELPKYVNGKNKEEKQITIDSSNKKKKDDSSLLIVILIIAITIISVVLFSIFSYNPSNSYYDGYDDIYVSPYHTVELEVTGSAILGVSLHYTLDDYNVDYDNVELPWSRKVSLAKEGEWYYVSAQNNYDLGYITATIKIDGVVVETDTSYSAYGVVSVGKFV